MKLTLIAIAAGAALTALSLLHGWVAVDTMRRGFPLWFAEMIPGGSYASSAGPGRDIWFFRGFAPLLANLLIWAAGSWICLRLLKWRRHA